jgi:hypothetical protein
MPPGIEDMLVRLIFRDQRGHGRNGRLLFEPHRLLVVDDAEWAPA